MIPKWKKLILLFWKNWKIQVWSQFLFEIFVVLATCFVLILIEKSYDSNRLDVEKFKPFEIKCP